MKIIFALIAIALLGGCVTNQVKQPDYEHSPCACNGGVYEVRA